MSESLLRPGIRLGGYPQKHEHRSDDFEQKAALLYRRTCQFLTGNRFQQNQVVNKIEAYAGSISEWSDQKLSIAIVEIKEKLQRYGLAERLIAQSFAIIREAAGRTLGKRHFNEQLFGGWIMIHGMLAEMETGEGKTLTTTLASCTAAMAGIPVHVITANDYLVSRDAEMMAPLYKRLGLTSGFVTDGMKTEVRRKVYQSDIVHTTNKQIAFDYLRDRIEIGEDTGRLKFQFRQIINKVKKQNAKTPLLKGLCFALIDEADSVLIDEAKTPLIITQTVPSQEDPQNYSDALYLVSALVINEDFTIDPKAHVIQLTEQGEAKLSELIIPLPKVWQNRRKREFLVKQAISAKYVYQKNKHYVVNEDKIQIIDEYTGRIMPDRAWEQGLQQMIEAKEGCLISERREPIARISYQRFFGRYIRLAGTSGTIKEVAAEMHAVYGLRTIKVATHRPSQRLLMHERIYRTSKLKRQAFIERINELYHELRPILIGTCTVAESEGVSSWLDAAGFPHRVLNANQDKYEAGIIAKAGQQQAITVATNMAGRGTDIDLGLGVSELGGLHVIALSINESRRIDRQLYGRCARQGDPGSAEAILSLQDPCLQQMYSSAMLKLLSKCCSEIKPLPDWLGKWMLRFRQRQNEKRQRRIRDQVKKQDRLFSKILAFSGKFE